MFDLVEFIGATRVSPLDGRGQSRTAQEVVVGMTSVRPPRRGRGDMVVQAAAVDVLRQPVGEARPRPQQASWVISTVSPSSISSRRSTSVRRGPVAAGWSGGATS